MRNVYKPLEDRILVKELKSESEKTEAGLILDTMRKQTREAEVITVGPGRYASETGVFMQNTLHEGDIVLIGDQGGFPITIHDKRGNKQECLLFRESDILMIIEKVDVQD